MLVGIIYLAASVFALGGLLVSWSIRRARQKGETIYCPMESDCQKVIHSRFARTFIVYNDTLGIIFYGLAAALSLILFFFFDDINDGTGILTAAAGAAFLFSVYLIYVQARVLKEWCALCALSAILSTAIFFSLLSILV